jgi:hypothetical protein
MSGQHDWPPRRGAVPSAMNTSIITRGDVRPAATPAVHDRTATYTSVPEPEARAKRIAAEAARWLQFATDRTTMKPAVLTAKALDSACFSVTARAYGVAVPSKLVGVREHQHHLWQIVRDGYRPWDRLEVDTLTTDGVRVLYGDTPLGELQAKHVPWVRSLLPFGLTVHLGRVTGHEVPGRTLGCNVVLGHVGPALAAYATAAGPSGDGVPGVRSRVFPSPALPVPAPSGDGARGERAQLRLVVPSETADPDDVVLYRDVDGTARATVDHVVRHSPTGIEWGYAGSGPADLARSVLLALTDEGTVDRHYQAFKDEVVARVPYAGGVLRAADVRRWVARQHA